MKFFDVRDQLNRQILAQDIRGFQATLKHIHGLHRRLAKTRARVLRRIQPGDNHAFDNSSKLSMRYCAASSLLISSTHWKAWAPWPPNDFPKKFDTSGKSPAYVHRRKN
jgi:hypothetical protein